MNARMTRMRRSTIRRIAESLSPWQQVKTSLGVGLVNSALTFIATEDVKKSAIMGLASAGGTYGLFMVNDDR